MKTGFDALDRGEGINFSDIISRARLKEIQNLDFYQVQTILLLTQKVVK
jgi:hypothetical protein